MQKHKAIGHLLRIGQLIDYDSGFSKRRLLVEVEGERLVFELINKDARIFKYAIGEHVEIEFQVRGCFWNNHYHVALMALTCESMVVKGDTLRAKERFATTALREATEARINHEKIQG